jgi:SAM-dependent methyltransferase
VLEAIARRLVCPRCRADLHASDVAFECAACGAKWPIIRGVPRFVGSQEYAANFGYEWNRHRRTQLDSETQRRSEETFVASTGLTPEEVRGKLVLDVGVGTGRFSDVVARWGGVPVGVDLSLAVTAAKRNLDRYAPNAFIAQADLFRLPFREGSFDIVFSIGVLHHTPSTREAFRAIASLVKPGGTLAVSVYHDAGDYYRWARRYRRLTTRMSHPFLHFLSYLAIPRYGLVREVRSFSPALAELLKWLVPMSEDPDPAWRVLDTFDWYSPRYQWLHPRDEVERWFLQLGFEEVRQLTGGWMASARGRRPLEGSLRLPEPIEERRVGELAPPPRWLPEGRWLRDPLLGILLGVELARTLRDVSRTAVLRAIGREGAT